MNSHHVAAISLLLALLFGGPVALFSRSSQQGNQDQASRAEPVSESDRARGKDQAERDEDGVERVFDRDHRDYHRWDHFEDAAYHLFWQEHHRSYRSYSSLNRREQSHYWKWRHAHTQLGRASANAESQ